MSLWTRCHQLVTKNSSSLFYQTDTYQIITNKIRKLVASFTSPDPPIGCVEVSTRWLPDCIAVVIACLLTNHSLQVVISESTLINPTLVLTGPVSPISDSLPVLVEPPPNQPWLGIAGTKFSTNQINQLLVELSELPKLSSIFNNVNGPVGFAPTREINVVEMALLIHVFIHHRQITTIPNDNPSVCGVFSVSDPPVLIQPSPNYLPLFCETSRHRWDTDAVPQQGIYLHGHRIRKYQPKPVRVVLTKSRPAQVVLTSLTQYYQVANRDYLREMLDPLPLGQLGSRLTQLLLFSKHNPLFLYQISSCNHQLLRVDGTHFAKSWIEIIWTNSETDTQLQQTTRIQEIETRLASSRRTSKVIVVANQEQDTFIIYLYYLSVLGRYFPVLHSPPPQPNVVWCPRRLRETHRIAPKITLTTERCTSFQFSPTISLLTIWHFARTSYPAKLQPDVRYQHTLSLTADESLAWLSERIRQPLLVFEPGCVPRIMAVSGASKYLGDSDTTTAYAYLVITLLYQIIAKLVIPTQSQLVPKMMPSRLVHVTIVSNKSELPLSCEIRRLHDPGNHLTMTLTGKLCYISGLVTHELFQKLAVGD